MTTHEVTGIDVSKYQAKIDWEQALKQGISFAFIRSSEGNKQTDVCFDRNMQETARLGIPRGVYHYFKPGRDWKAQRDLFVGLINKYPFELGAVVDVETDDGLGKNDTNNALAKFCRGVAETITPRDLMIYTSPGFFNSQLPLTDYAWRLKLWVAHWTTASKPQLPREWSNHKKTWVFWQHSAKGNHLGAAFGVPSGGSTDICLDRFKGSLAKFRETYQLSPLPEPPPPPPEPPTVFEAPKYIVLPASLHVFDHPCVTARIVDEVKSSQVVQLQDIAGTDEVWIKIGQDPDRWVLFSYNGRQLLAKPNL
jgi:GH25 family lysozyme M1 (1,4-beta-N-acetylmuramidase)